jgi:hypothetical protein
LGLVWPDPLPAYGAVRLRPFRRDDLGLVAALSADPYLPLIGTIPSRFTSEEGLAYIERQHQRLVDGTGWSFVVVDARTDEAVGTAGLWLSLERPATAGYAVAPEARGRGYATAALTALTESPGRGPGLTGSSSTSSRARQPRSRSRVAAAIAPRDWCPTTARLAAGSDRCCGWRPPGVVYKERSVLYSAKGPRWSVLLCFCLSARSDAMTWTSPAAKAQTSAS